MIKIEKYAKETNRDYALRAIRDNIIKLQIKPGSMISEQDIAEELNLSRTPVHEAMQELSKTKIIEIFPQKGSKVSLIDMTLVDEAVFMRSTIEAALTEEACTKATSQDILALEENVNLQEFYLSNNSLDKIMDLDNSFHETMYRITNKMQCFYMVKLMNIHYDRFRELRLHSSNPQSIINEHKEILTAFKAKDCAKVKELILKHLNRLYIDEKDIRQKYPDYFA